MANDYLTNNQRILKYLSRPQRSNASSSVAKDEPSTAPTDVESPYLDLGTHPDLVRYLWNEMAEVLPTDCRWIAYGTPVLLAPSTSKIFAFAEGTKTCAVALSDTDCATAISEGAETVVRYRAYPSLGIDASEVSASDVGPGWVFCYNNRRSADWCMAAYEHALLL